MELCHVKGDTWYFRGLESIPLYRIDRNRCVLLDTGRLSERKDLQESLDREGLVPVGVFASHSHYDHTANLFWLKEHYGAKTCLPRLEAVAATNILINRLPYGNVPISVVEEFYSGMTGVVDEVVGAEDGETVFCGVAFGVIHAPGHSQDQICTVTPDNVCYLADAVMTKDVIANAKLPFALSHTEARASMKKIRSKPFDICVAAHSGVVDDLPGTVDANLEKMDSFCLQLQKLIRKPMPLHEIICETIRQEHLFTSDVIKAATYAHNVQYGVEYLVDIGHIIMTAERGIVCYSPT